MSGKKSLNIIIAAKKMPDPRPSDDPNVANVLILMAEGPLTMDPWAYKKCYDKGYKLTHMYCHEVNALYYSWFPIKYLPSPMVSDEQKWVMTPNEYISYLSSLAKINIQRNHDLIEKSLMWLIRHVDFYIKE